jgi:large conductance mechanosensitive channel
MKHMNDFINFIKGFGVIGLALGVVIGGATNTLVQSLSNDIINPLIGLLFEAETLTQVTIGVVRIGAFADALINFLDSNFCCLDISQISSF